MDGLVFWIIVLFIIYWVNKSNKNAPQEPNPLEKRNTEWVNFIASYLGVAKSKQEKALIKRMLKDASAQGLPVPDNMRETGLETPGSDIKAAEVAATSTQIGSEAFWPEKSAPNKPKAQVQLDNASLLLYFGAFLFVAAAGLFVGMSGVVGELKTIVVLVVSLVMYSGGIWLHDNRKKLQQSGLAFVGIGMTVTPLSGLAAYNYVFEQSQGRMVWFVTSLVCMALYAHALIRLRKPLINYIFIFTFLSLFESGIAMFDAPIYYFGWGMALVGIIFSIVGRAKGIWQDLQESSRESATLFLPLSVLVSLVMVANHGFAQLGVSLLLAAVFYGLETLRTDGEAKLANSIVAQVSLNGAVAALAYSIKTDVALLPTVLLVFNALQLLVVMFASNEPIWRNFASVVVVTQGVAFALALFTDGPVLMASLAGLITISAMMWLKQKRSDLFAVAGLAWIMAPIIFCQIVSDPARPIEQQSILLMLALVGLFFVASWRKLFDDKDYTVLSQIYLASSIVVVVASFWASSLMVLFTALVVIATFVLLTEERKDSDWAIAASVISIAPVAHAFTTGDYLFTANLVTVLVNIGLVLRYRAEWGRWIGTGLWLCLPLSLDYSLVDWRLDGAMYAWAYAACLVGLLCARAIARGVAFLSTKVALAKYASNASMSYVAGYILAASLAVISSLGAVNSQLHTSLILSLLIVVTVVLSEVIEKRADILMLVPLGLQALLLSVVRPEIGDSSMQAFLLISTTLSVVSYLLMMGSGSKDKLQAFQNGALVSSFVAPFAIFFVGDTIWPMPFGLLVAATMLYYHIRNTDQQQREAVGFMFTAATFWFMGGVWDVTTVQAYVHILVAQFAAYAYWRHIRKETANSDNYLYAMLATATIPLALQALNGEGGELYGWWLLLEEICFMVLGMMIGKRFVTMWGLYVAIGAVLYQLRDLGFAALGVLAMFLIGLAIYKIQKYNDKN